MSSIITVCGFLLALAHLVCLAQSKSRPTVELVSSITQDQVFYRIPPTPANKEDSATYSRVRKFIWNRWHDKQKGDLTLERYTKEGEQIINVFHFSTNESGAWNIQVTINSYQVARGQKAVGVEPKLQIRSLSIASVRRIAISNNRKPTGKPIPDSARRPDGHYLIQLLDIEGIVVFKI